MNDRNSRLEKAEFAPNQHEFQIVEGGCAEQLPTPTQKSLLTLLAFYPSILFRCCFLG